MDLRYSREVTVGAIVIAAIVVFVFGTMWLSGRSVHAGNVVGYAVRQRERTQTRLAGTGIGSQRRQDREDRIRGCGQGTGGREPAAQDPPPGRCPRQDRLGNPGRRLRGGLRSRPCRELLPPGKVILGTQDLGLTGKALELSDRADSILVGAQAIVNKQTADQLRSTLTALEGTLKAAQRTMQIYADTSRGPTAELTKTMATFRQLSARLDSTLVVFRTDTISANLAAMTSQLTSTGGRLDTLLAGINRGQGTLGKFVTDSGLYYDIRDLSKSMKELLDELKKNPGKVGVTVKLF